MSCAADDLSSPNGHILTPDGRTLIVAESGGSRLTAFDVAADGRLTGRRLYAPLVPAEGSPLPMAPPDGICLDEAGAVWVADPIGARVFRVLPGGEVTDQHIFDDVIPVACVLGGPDRRTLLVCVAASSNSTDASTPACVTPSKRALSCASRTRLMQVVNTSSAS